jgi:hypothetical protein
VVVAAGNQGRDNSFGTNGYGTIQASGNDPYVITVGTVKTMGTATRGEGAHAHRPHREARPGGTGESHDLADGQHRQAGERLSG